MYVCVVLLFIDFCSSASILGRHSCCKDLVLLDPAHVILRELGDEMS